MKTLKVNYEGETIFVEVEEERPLDTLYRKFCDKVDSIVDKAVIELERIKPVIVTDPLLGLGRLASQGGFWSGAQQQAYASQQASALMGQQQSMLGFSAGLGGLGALNRLI